VDRKLLRSSRILAGLAVDPPVEVPAEAFRAQARRIAPVMAEYREKTGVRMQAWAARELPSAAGQTVFYPFSGPDFLAVHRLYPDASRYVLVALQEGGRPPVVERMADRIASATLRVHANAIISYVRKGFFVTARLGKGYSVPGVWTGITGMLMAFAALEGFDVVQAAPLRMMDGGDDVQTVDASGTHEADWSSVRLVLRDAAGDVKLLDYVDADLSNRGLPPGSAAWRCMDRWARGPVLIKAASHLLQFPPFSTLRDIILMRTSELVQDETGVRYADLIDGFDTTLYGRFVGVNPLFDPRPQRALMAAYRERSDVRPLDFPFGYHKAAGPCLMVARRKGGAGR